MQVPRTGVVITDKNLRIVSSNEEAGLLSVKGGICGNDSFFDHFPQLIAHMQQGVPEEETVLPVITSRGSRSDVRVLPCGSQVCFLFTPRDHSGVPEAAPGLKEMMEQNKHLMSIIEEAPIGIIFIDSRHSAVILVPLQNPAIRLVSDVDECFPIWLASFSSTERTWTKNTTPPFIMTFLCHIKPLTAPSGVQIRSHSTRLNCPHLVPSGSIRNM